MHFSMKAFRRGRDGSLLLVVSNMTPVPRHGYRFRVPNPGPWRELLNTDGSCYGESNLGDGGFACRRDPT